MSATEYPTTDVEEIKARLDAIEEAIGSLNARLDNQATGINGIGQNLQWLVSNTQGIFQMFSSPAFMSQMTNTLTGMMNNGQPGPQESASVGPTGEDTGTG